MTTRDKFSADKDGGLVIQLGGRLRLPGMLHGCFVSVSDIRRFKNNLVSKAGSSREFLELVKTGDLDSMASHGYIASAVQPYREYTTHSVATSEQVIQGLHDMVDTLKHLPHADSSKHSATDLVCQELFAITQGFRYPFDDSKKLFVQEWGAPWRSTTPLRLPDAPSYQNRGRHGAMYRSVARMLQNTVSRTRGIVPPGGRQPVWV